LHVSQSRSEGYFAAKLIEECGLKGFQVGGAQVSEKHANFIINKGNATAADIENLILQIQKEVYKQKKIKLVTEIRIIGEQLDS
jgi:UDP-N-acetylmuramate dehydrogenase